MDNKKVVYYQDDSDDFIDKKYSDIKIDENYKYLHKNPLWNFFSFIVYRLIAMPMAYIYLKLKFRIKFVGKEKLKDQKDGYFLYLNHTQTIGDALLPTIISFPKKVYVLVHPDNVSIPFWGNIIKLLGPLPIPGNIKAWKNFNDALEHIIEKKHVVAIYPEAHVWDYYTKIRNFNDSSFKFPLKYHTCCYSATVTYKSVKNRKKPCIVVYVDGPFNIENTENIKQSQSTLRNKVYNTMCERANNNDVEYIKYEKIKEEVFD